MSGEKKKGTERIGNVAEHSAVARKPIDKEDLAMPSSLRVLSRHPRPRIQPKLKYSEALALLLAVQREAQPTPHLIAVLAKLRKELDKIGA